MPPSSFEVVRLGETDSTNVWLLDAARAGAADRTVVVADFQRRGKGRLDRRWEAPAGTALLCSVLLRPPLAPRSWHFATIAVALSALEATNDVAGLAVDLKWPNDLVVEDRKLAGILAEADASAPDRVAIVVGIGLNLTWPGPPDAKGTSILAETGRTVERDDFLVAFLASLGPAADELHHDEGRHRLLDAYRSHTVTIGRAVRVELADGDLVGTARSVTDEGHLVVSTPHGDRVVTAGDVVHVRPADQGANGASE